MTRNENQMYSDISSIAKSLEKIAKALDNKVSNELVDATTKDIPGFEGVLNDLDNLCNVRTNPKNDPERDKFEDKDTYDNDLIHYHNDILADSDYRIRLVASNYEDDYATKKDAILDYVELEFGSEGARYTDVIKFAYYLGAPNAPKYTSENRGYYSCAFSPRMDGHLIQGGKDFLVKGINKDGKERYFAYNSVNKYTDYYKRIQ